MPLSLPCSTAASWGLLCERWGWGSQGPAREDRRDPSTAQSIHSQVTLEHPALAMRVTGLTLEHECHKSSLCSPGVIEVHPPEPKQKTAAVQDEQLACCKNPGITPDTPGMPLPGRAGLRRRARAGCRQGKAVSSELRAGSWSTVSSSPGSTDSERGGWVCVQLQHWARDANGKQKQFKVPGGGRNTNSIMAWSLLQSC